MALPNARYFRHTNRDLHQTHASGRYCLSLTSLVSVSVRKLATSKHFFAVASSLSLQSHLRRSIAPAGNRCEMEAQLVHRGLSTEPSTPIGTAPVSEAGAEQDELRSRDSSAPVPAPPTEPPPTSDNTQNDQPGSAVADSPVLELAPLPTEFNPDATPPPPLPPKDEEDELAFEPHPDPEPEPEPAHQAETNYEDNPELYRSLAVLTQYEDGEDQAGMDVDYQQQPAQEVPTATEAVETAEESASEVQHANGTEQSTEDAQGHLADANGGPKDDAGMDIEQPQEQPESNEDSPMREPSPPPDSPLSDIPDLPQEIDFSEQKPKELTPPPPAKRKPSRAGSEVEDGGASKKKKMEPEELGPNTRPVRGKPAAASCD